MSRPDAEAIHVVIRNDGSMSVYINPVAPIVVNGALDPDAVARRISEILKQDRNR